jgi:hypothetical protein
MLRKILPTAAALPPTLPIYDVAYHTYVSTDLVSNVWNSVMVEEAGAATILENPNDETVQARIPASQTGTNEVLFVQVRAEASD